MSEPSAMRQHLIDFAAQRDWTGWAEFLPIFGDWLDERGEPEAMACRAAWKLAKALERIDGWIRWWRVPIPDCCLHWADDVLLETSLIRRLDWSVNQRWFLHCGPGTLNYEVRPGQMGLWPHPVTKQPIKFTHYYFWENSLRQKGMPAQQGQKVDHLIVRHGFAALFWPPDTFERPSNPGDERQANLADNAQQAPSAGSD
jgi:hypothetical protein